MPAGIFLDDETSPTPRGVFPLGTTTATLTVTDGNGGVDSATVKITVIDTTPPDVECSTDVVTLWPPNHQMVQVQVFVAATDTCATPNLLALVSATVQSSEPDDAPGTGDGETTGDTMQVDGYGSPVDISPVFTFDMVEERYVGTLTLRAEREGTGHGRTYTVKVRVVDPMGNGSNASCVVVAPHDRRNR